MAISTSVATFIAEQRELLDQLEQFAETPEYRRLLALSTPMAEGDVEPWLAEWLIQPVFSLNDLPIKALAQPGGLELVESRLVWIATCVDA